LEQPVEPKKPKRVGPPKPKYIRKTKTTGSHITQDWQPAKTVGRPLAFSGDMLDIFAAARDEIASGKARGKIRDTGKNIKRNT
jgi:hypothetical protein